jgi:hypothetical protein
MALTLAALLTLVNEITGRAETDLTNFLRNVIHDLERDSVFLEATESITLTAGTRNYALSGLTYTYRKPFHLQPKDSTPLYYAELDEVSYEEYRDRLTNNAGNSQPRVFSVFNESIYLDPPPSSTYATMDIWGPILHGDTMTTISYTEKFRNLLVNGCAFEVFKRYGLSDVQKAKDCLSLYESEKQGFINRKANERNHFVKTQDM